ncbi:SPOR domain-containing protein, partial [Pseudoxanthobacter sp.]|uniref:SPOR domain-containing protein n=1 Tax=Pseudoxanthobacter sp. TaxID=1925742 RepID=UPI002FE1ABBF
VPAASVPAVRPRTAPAAVAAAEPAVPVTAYADDGNAALDAIGALTAGAQPAAKPAAAATAATDEAGGDQRRVKVLTIANPVINTAQAAEAAPAPAPKAAARTAVTAADAAYANDPIATQVAAAEAANARAASTQFAGTPFQDGAFNPDAVRKLIETRRVMVASAAQATVPAAGAVTSDAAPADNDAADAGEEAPAPARKKAAASRREPAGWQIQIGAVPTSKAAASFLAEARKKGGRALAGAEPYTEAVSKGGSTLYRARFSGFGGEKEAQQACAQLKKQSYACMAFRK